MGCKMRSTLTISSVLFLALVATWAVPSGEPSATSIKTETFNRDPRWDAKNNCVIPANPPTVNQNFGYVRRRNSVQGEIGGEVWRSVKPATYGKRLGPYTMNDKLQCSGTLSLVHATAVFGWQTGSTIFVGFFNHQAQGWRPLNFMGFRLEGFNEPDGATIEVSYGTRAWTAGGAFVNAAGGAQERNVRDLDSRKLLRVAPDGAKHIWSLEYDPQGGDGYGLMIFTFDGARTTLKVHRGHREQGATFDRFGIFNNQIPGNSMTAYFGELVINGKREDLSKDPGWEGKGNRSRYRDFIRYGANDFGYRRTNYAGGAPGELGGRFFSCDPHEHEFKGYYGDRIGRLTLDDKLTASGRFAARHFSVDSSFALGWFNSQEQGYPIKNFVGVYFDSLTSVGRIIQPLYGTAEGNLRQNGAPSLQFTPDGSTYEWTLTYDPADGGSIMFTLNGKSMTMRLRPGDKAKGTTFDRFGVFNMQWANSKWCEVYLDDLRYTVAEGAR